VEKLTHQLIESLKPPARGRYERRDSEARGLAIQVTERGAKSWLFWYTPKGSKRQKLTLGPFPAISLSTARQLANKHKTSIAEGGDPAAEKRTAKVAAKQAAISGATPQTVAEALALYIERKRLNGRRAWKGDEWNGDTHILPAWGARNLKDISPANIVALLNGIATKKHRGKTTKGIAANRVYSLLSGLCNFAIRQAWIGTNPMAGLKPPVDEQPREFTLPGDQVRAIWRMVRTLEDARVRDFYRLTFLTCARRGELLRMRWNEIDLEAGVWVVPGARAKNKHSWRIPLTGAALSLLRERKAVSTREYILAGAGGRRDGVLKKDVLNEAHHALLEKLHAAGVNYRCGDLEFRGHDTRSLCATQLGEWGIPEPVIDKVLSHSENRGITRRHYNHHDYFPEHARALIRWENWLNGIEQRGDVVPLFTAAAS
jgi:integrase